MNGTTHVIGLPCTPSEHVSQTTEPATQLTLSYGGGMGGSKREIYAKSIKEIQKFGMTMLEVTPFFEEPEEVNPKFIVASQECKIVTDIVNTTGHSNYNKQTCTRSTITRYFRIGVKDTIKHDKFNYVPDWETRGGGLKPIKAISSQQ